MKSAENDRYWLEITSGIRPRRPKPPLSRTSRRGTLRCILRETLTHQSLPYRVLIALGKLPRSARRIYDCLGVHLALEISYREFLYQLRIFVGRGWIRDCSVILKATGEKRHYYMLTEDGAMAAYEASSSPELVPPGSMSDAGIAEAELTLDYR